MPEPPCTPKRSRRRSVLTTLAGALAVTAVLAYVLADRREEFGTALGAAPLWILLTATGTLGALAYAAWAGVDRLWTLRPAARLHPIPSPPHVDLPHEPRPAIGVTR